VTATRITWEAGGDGALGEVDDLHVTVRASARAFPPGATASGTLHSEPPTSFAMKVAGSRREADGFVVRGRLVNATVAIRSAFAGAGAPKV
jgi:hypothetical protein